MTRPEPGEWEIVIRLGRPFDITAGTGRLLHIDGQQVLRIPFATRASAEQALAELQIGIVGNPVVAGQVVKGGELE